MHEVCNTPVCDVFPAAGAVVRSDVSTDLLDLIPIAAAPRIAFSRPVVASAARDLIEKSLLAPLSGGGAFTAQCHALLRRALPGTTPFLTQSCTDALELAALALDLAPGDEVVMPSWTFPSSANAFALRGAVPVLVDVQADTLCIDPDAAAAAITKRTRAILCVHYAGVACDMARLSTTCRDNGIALIEDAAQGYGASWRDQALGGIGDLGAFSFHGTKNVSCGEGGALIVSRDDLLERVEVGWEKGTNRLRYTRGEVAKYQWLDVGSSFLPSELTAALLAAQLADAASVNAARCRAWTRYATLLGEADLAGVRLPTIPPYAGHNAHIFALRVREPSWRDAVLADLAAAGIEARSHYEPLHLAPAAQRLCRTAGHLDVTEAAAGRLVRLPLHPLMTASDQERVVGALADAVRSLA